MLDKTENDLHSAHLESGRKIEFVKVKDNCWAVCIEPDYIEETEALAQISLVAVLVDL